MIKSIPLLKVEATKPLGRSPRHPRGLSLHFFDRLHFRRVFPKPHTGLDMLMFFSRFYFDNINGKIGFQNLQKQRQTIGVRIGIHQNKKGRVMRLFQELIKTFDSGVTEDHFVVEGGWVLVCSLDTKIAVSLVLRVFFSTQNLCRVWNLSRVKNRIGFISSMCHSLKN